MNYLKTRLKYFLDAFFWKLVAAFVRPDIAPPPQGSVLVIAPHPDDEAFACGATIARLCAQNTKVHIIVVSDGTLSTPAPGQTIEQLAKLRQQETLAATQALGLTKDDVSFLNHADGALDSVADKIQLDIKQHIKKLNPALILAPHAWDAHIDHKIVASVMKDIEIPCRCYEYLVWVPTKKLFSCLLHLATHEDQIIMPMKKYKERKEMAINCYASQTGGTSFKRGQGFLDPAFVALFLGKDEVFFQRKAY